MRMLGSSVGLGVENGIELLMKTKAETLQKSCRLLFVGTGALLSPVTVQQGESIPGIAHGVVIQYKPMAIQED